MRLPRALIALAEYGKSLGFEYEVIAVVERSRDNTLRRAGEVASGRRQVQIIENPDQRGKGYALRTGVRRARGEFVFVMDADLSVPVDHIGVFIERFRNSSATDILVGNRQHPDSRIERRQSRFRETLGKLFNVLVRLLGLSRILDTQCGFKAFRREAARTIYERQTVDGFACDVEVLLLAEGIGFQIEEMPVRWINSPDSRVRIVVDSIDMLIDLFRLRHLVRRTLKDNPYKKP
jgi:dolichyl-phosphate beta-glucosyltransferase